MQLLKATSRSWRRSPLFGANPPAEGASEGLRPPGSLATLGVVAAILVIAITAFYFAFYRPAIEQATVERIVVCARHRGEHVTVQMVANQFEMASVISGDRDRGLRIVARIHDCESAPRGS